VAQRLSTIAPYMACDLLPVPGRIRVSCTPHKVLSNPLHVPETV